MPPFPAPYLERRTFQALPDAGTPLTETALLQLLYDLLTPLHVITYAFVLAHEEMSTGRATTILVEFIEEIMEQAVLLLAAWHEHQADADEPEEDDAPDDLEASTPPRRRSRRRDQGA